MRRYSPATSAKRVGANILQGVGQLAEDAGVPGGQGLEHYGESVQRANPSRIGGFGDIVAHPLTTLKEQAAETAAQLAPYAAGVYAGQRVGGRVAGTPGRLVGGIVGGASPIFAQEYGGIRADQQREHTESIPKALAAATGATALESAFGPEGTLLKTALGEGVVRAGENRLQSLARGAATGAAEEFPTEFAQNAVEQVGAGQDPTTADALRQDAFSGTLGTIGGGVGGAGVRALAPRVNQAGQPPADALSDRAPDAADGGPPIAPAPDNAAASSTPPALRDPSAARNFSQWSRFVDAGWIDTAARSNNPAAREAAADLRVARNGKLGAAAREKAAERAADIIRAKGGLGINQAPPALDEGPLQAGLRRAGMQDVELLDAEPGTGQQPGQALGRPADIEADYTGGRRARQLPGPESQPGARNDQGARRESLAALSALPMTHSRAERVRAALTHQGVAADVVDHPRAKGYFSVRARSDEQQTGQAPGTADRGARQRAAGLARGASGLAAYSDVGSGIGDGQARTGQQPAPNKPVADMSAAELRDALLTDAATGIGNRRAFEEAPASPAVGIADLDGLKWVNDTFGHAGGDALLKTAATALHAASGGNAYRLHGDEFALRADDENHATTVLDAANDQLSKATLTFTRPDGTVETHRGFGFSYGTGQDLGQADAKLGEHKAARTRAGLRVERGQAPGARVGSAATGDRGPPDAAGRPDNQDRNQVDQHQADNRAVYEQPLADLHSASEVLPQFKAGGDEKTGVVEPLGGTFERTGVAPIQVWERADGKRFIASGRHRADLAARSGETSIPAQLHREADGFTKQMAARLDAELNIRDEQGTIHDYATYFKDTGLTKQEAEQRGLLSRYKGRAGFAIAQSATEPVFAAHRAGKISDEAARQIAEAAPNDERLQTVGLDAVNRGASIADAANTMRAVSALQTESSQQGDIFGFDDSGMRQAQAMAKIASTKQRAIRERIASVRGAAKRPDKARALGVDVKDPEAVKTKIDALQAEAARWDNWNTDSELVDQIRAQMSDKPDSGAPVRDNAPTQPAESGAPAAQPQAAKAPTDRTGEQLGTITLPNGTTMRDAVLGGPTSDGRREVSGMTRNGPTKTQLTEAQITKARGRPPAPDADPFDTGATDATQTLAAADRPENFNLAPQTRSDEQAEAEAEAQFNTDQGELFGGQTQAGQVAADAARQQREQQAPDAGTGGGLFAHSDRQTAPTEARETGQNSDARSIDPYQRSAGANPRVPTFWKTDELVAEIKAIAGRAGIDNAPDGSDAEKIMQVLARRLGESGMDTLNAELDAIAPDTGRTRARAQGGRDYNQEAQQRTERLRQAAQDKQAGRGGASPPQASGYGANNKVFTADAAAKARAVLRAKLGQLNTGFDPEIFQAGVTLAGYHIEAGARRFTQFAARMVDDMGDAVRPFLKLFYNGVRDYPGFDTTGMDSAQTVRAADVNAIAPRAPDSATLEPNPQSEASRDDRQRNGTDRQEPLAPASTELVRGDEGQRDTGRRSPSGREPDARRNGRADDGGGQRSPSLGSRQGLLHSEKPGPGSPDDDGHRELGERLTPPDPTPAEAAPGPVEAGHSAAPGRARTPALAGDNPGNYRITDADGLGTGTRGQRIDNNIAAIETVKALEAEHRYATPAEQAVMAKYVGWGGLKRVFQIDEQSKPQDKRANERLRALLTDAEFAAAQRSILDAHYTSPAVVRGLYDAVAHMGATGGRVLEPSVGSGNFLGLMPEAMIGGSRVDAVELDSVSAAIAKHLYPDAQIVNKGFQKANLPFAAYDLVIGNPPFGDRPITDNNKARRAINGFTIHNYFIAKSALHLKPGGIMGVVVTNRFLDKPHSKERAYLAGQLQFLGAVRLSNRAFAESAGTEVTTDLVFFRKPVEAAELDQAPAWANAVAFANEDGDTVRANEYFAQRPHLMLGKPTMAGTMYASGRGNEFTLEARPGQDIGRDLAAVLQSPEFAGLRGVAGQRADAAAEVTATEYRPNLEDLAIGDFALDDNRVVQRLDDDEAGNPAYRDLAPDTQWTEKTQLGETRLARIRGLLGLRNAAYTLMTAERIDAPDIEALRNALNNDYDAFVKAFGYINDTANASLLGRDVRVEVGLEGGYKPAVSAARAKRLGVEARAASAKKESLLVRRINYPRRAVTSVASARDGYIVSQTEKGRLDLDYIAGLYDKPVSDVIAELSEGDKPLIYQDPETHQWIAEDAYLSGNVKAKLKRVDGLPGYEKNAASLRAVLPKDVPADQINANFGASWLPASVYEDFAGAIGIDKPRVTISRSLGTVTLAGHASAKQHADYAEYRAGNLDQAEVFNRLASGKPLVVRFTDSDGKSHVSEEATDALRGAASAMREFFADWVTAEPDRAATVAQVFNDTMNTTIERVFDGSLLRLTGANPAIRLRDSQARAAWRMVQSDRVLLDHVVGAGKTYTTIAGLMERRRMGLTRKPLVVVPNHKVGDWAHDWLTMYPGANVLAATNQDFAAKNRKRLFARIATGDYDAIIVGHSSFGFIPMLPDNEAGFIRGQIEILERAKKELGEDGDSSQKRTVRNLENAKAKLEARIEKLVDEPRDPVATIEEMGIDSLTVDESQEFKNLMISTAMTNIAGMGNLAGSKKAMHLFMVMRQIQNQQGSTYFATGTPIANTMTELYTLLRYMNYEALEERNLEAFDAWARAHASIEDRVELGAGGKFKQRSVMATFQNMPELMQTYNQFADVVTMADLKRLYSAQIERENAANDTHERTAFPVPQVADGGRRLNLAEPNPLQEQYSEYLRARADALQAPGNDIDPSVDNMLLVITDSRKMSMDIRMVDGTAGDYDNNKTSRAAREIKRIYDATQAQRGTQLVFSDLGTPVKFARNSAKKIVPAMIARLPRDMRDRAAQVTQNMEPGEAGAYLAERMRQAIDDAPELDAELEKLQHYIDSDLRDDQAALTTAQAGFSVYDDLKAKLVAAGIPDNEIAFIHDYNTSKAKSELFDNVNAGQVRVLLGSSAKMGAGTNVQERIVALHHLDAPWRPADVEQREGRAIRQGNALYEADPDNFAVEIAAYSTERTLDSMMWQTLARKQEMLGAFRNGAAREVDDVYDDGTGYSDFMAESTGNPVFKEAAQLKLEAKALRSRKRRVQAERAGAEHNVRALPARIAKKHEDQGKLERAAAAFEAATDATITDSDGARIPADYAAKAQPIVDAWREKMTAFEAAQVEHNKALQRWEAAPPDTRGDKPKGPTRPPRPTMATLAKKSREAKFYDDLRAAIKQADEDDAPMTAGYHVAGVPVAVEFEPAFGGLLRIGYNDAEPADVPSTSIDRRLLSHTQPATAAGHAREAARERGDSADRDEATLAASKQTLDKISFEGQARLDAIEARLATANEEIEALEAHLRDKAAASGNRYMGGKPHLDDRFSRGARPARGLDVARLRARLRDIFGDGVARMEATGRLTLVDSDDELPARLRGRAAKGVVIADDGAAPRVYLVAERLTPDNVKGVFLHEVGVHYGLADMLGAEPFAAVLDRLAALNRVGNAAVRAAYTRVPESTPLALRDEEALGYLVESNPDIPIVRRLIAKLRAFLFRTFGIGGDRLSDADMAALAQAAAKRSVRRGGQRDAAPGNVQPAFSDEMGSAEDKAKLEALQSMAPVVVGDQGLATGPIKAARDRARELYRPLQRIPAKTQDGRLVRFGNAGFRDTARHAADRRVLEIIPHLRAAVARAVPLWSEPPDKAVADNIRAFHNYGVKVRFPGGDAYVRLVIREQTDGTYYYDNYASDIAEIEKASADTPLQLPRLQSRSDTAAARPINKLAQWVAAVNAAPDERYSRVADEGDAGARADNATPEGAGAATTRTLGQLYDANGKPMAGDAQQRETARTIMAAPITREEADALAGLPGVMRFATRGPETTGHQGWFINRETIGQSVDRRAPADVLPRNHLGAKATSEQIRVIDKALARERVEFGRNVGPEGDTRWYRVAQPGQQPTPRTRYDEPLFSIDAGAIDTGAPEPVDDAKAEALRRAGLAWATKTPRERMTAALAHRWEDFKTSVLGRWREGFFDQFAPIKAIEGDIDPEQSGYLAARLSTGASSTMYAALLYGAPVWRAGIIGKKANSRGLLSILAPVKGEMNQWLGWMVARRAEYLADQGRENNLRAEDIRELTAGISGERLARYEAVAKEFRGFNTDMLRLARDAGLLSEAQVNAFANDAYYVPFYRQDDSDPNSDPTRPFTKRGLSHQDAGIKTLKGGTQALADPLENVFANMARLVDASLKNHAMRQITRNAAHLMTPEPEGNRGDPDVVRVMDDGAAHYYRVADRALVRSVAGLHAGPIAGLRVFRTFKRLLTLGVTADPAFMMRNFSRDMLAAWIQDKNGFRFAVDSLRGATDTLRSLRDHDNADIGLQTMMFAGASFVGGHAYGDDPASQANALRRALRAKGLTPDGIDRHMNSLVDTPARWWSAYRELGDAAENANRVAVYRAAKQAGRSDIEAVFDSKDLLDFSLHGSFKFMQVLSDVLPFFNARVQGIYKVGRAGVDNPRQLATRGLMVMGATLILAAANAGNDDYDDLPGWDKDLYWHLFLPGGVHLRIPKPFELGVLFGTAPERMLRAATGADTPRESYRALVRNLGQVMAFDPTPQLVNPALEVYTNYDKFRDAPIENLGDAGKLPGARYSSYTSPTMVEIGGALGISPKKLEHLWSGYLGTLGSYALGASDFLVRHARGDIGPSLTVNDIPVVSSFVRGDGPSRSTKYAGEFYDLLNQANQVYSTIRQYRESGQNQRARALLKSNRGLLGVRQSLTAAQRQAGDIRDRMDQIRQSTTLSAAAKRQRLDRMQRLLNQTMKSTVQQTRAAAAR